MGAPTKGNRGGKSLADQFLPRRDVRYRSDRQHIKYRPHKKRGGDRRKKFTPAESWMSFFRNFWHGFKSGHEIRNDLQGEQNRSERRMAKQRPHIRNRAHA